MLISIVNFTRGNEQVDDDTLLCVSHPPSL
jgi:hypothetical protein